MSKPGSSEQAFVICPQCQHQNRPQARFCQHCGYAFQFIETPTHSHPSIFSPIQPGMILDNRYKVIKKLGESEQGRVFLAQDISGRYFALKQIRALYAQERLEDYNLYIRSFQREAQILSSLPHPYLPIARDFLPEEYLIIMDYIEGVTLAEILEKSKTPIPEQRVVRWAIQVCEALRYLHDKKPAIIHADHFADALRVVIEYPTDPQI